MNERKPVPTRIVLACVGSSGAYSILKYINLGGTEGLNTGANHKGRDAKPLTDPTVRVLPVVGAWVGGVVLYFLKCHRKSSVINVDRENAFGPQ